MTMSDISMDRTQAAVLHISSPKMLLDYSFACSLLTRITALPQVFLASMSSRPLGTFWSPS